MTNPDCKNCPYRWILARMFDIHICYLDCDKAGTEECDKIQQLEKEGATNNE